MSISEKITQYRKMRGLTQETLGEALGITAQAISKWEVGSTMPDIFLLPRLCELLDVPPDVLLEIPQDLSVRYLMKTVSALGREHYSEHRGVDMTSLLLDIVGRTIGNDGHNYDGNNLHIGDEFIRLRLQRRDSREGNESENECKRMDEAAFLLCGTGIQTDYLAARPSSLDEFLDLFRNEHTFAVLWETAVRESVTFAELEKKTGIPTEELKASLLALLEMSVLTVQVDPNGKRGYVRDHGFAAMMMVLAAADACACLGGPGINAVWSN